MTQPATDQPLQIDPAAVADILGEDPLSKALYERACFLSIVRRQEDELRYLRALREEPPQA